MSEDGIPSSLLYLNHHSPKRFTTFLHIPLATTFMCPYLDARGARRYGWLAASWHQFYTRESMNPGEQVRSPAIAHPYSQGNNNSVTLPTTHRMHLLQGRQPKASSCPYFQFKVQHLNQVQLWLFAAWCPMS